MPLAQSITMTAKQLKKIQAKEEKKLKGGDSISAYWSYHDHNDVLRTFTARAEVSSDTKDSISASLTEQITDNNGRIIYPEGWIVFIPKTNSPVWGLHDRFERLPL